MKKVKKNFARAVRARKEGKEPNALDLDFPTVEDGLRGMQFIYKVIESGKSEQKWIDF